MDALKHRDVPVQKPFADATKQTHEIAASRPNAFHGVVVDFANAITVIITRPFALSWRMADGPVGAASSSQMSIGRPFISVDDRIRAGMGHEQWFECGTVTVVADAQPDLPTTMPNDTHNRRSITGPGSMTSRLICSSARRVLRLRVRTPFLASVLIEFIGFCYWIDQWPGRGKNAYRRACVSRDDARASGCD